MAIAIMGGMTTSTFLTLVVVPIAYSMVVGFLDRLARRKAEAKAEGVHPAPSISSVQPVGD
jgi:hypothetical protein